MTRKVNVIGVGMVPFAKPGESEEYNVMASKAGRAALQDAGIPFAEVQQAYAGYRIPVGRGLLAQFGIYLSPIGPENDSASTRNGRSVGRLARAMRSSSAYPSAPCVG